MRRRNSGAAGDDDERMRPSKQCEVCRDAQPKYKCPSCLLPYCSLACFKKHKEIPCQKPLPVKEKSVTFIPQRAIKVDEQASVLQMETFQSIVNCGEIRDELKDEHLRKIIHEIDCSNDPVRALDKAMEEQTFRQFTDKILSIVSPQE